MSDIGNENLRSQDMARNKREIAGNQRRRLVLRAGLAAAVALGAAGTYEINKPHEYVPDEVETGPVLIQPDAVLRSEPAVPDSTYVEQRGKNDISRDNLNLEGQPIKDKALTVKNLLIVTMPSGEKWGILKGVKEGSEDKKIFFQITEKGVKHPVINQFADIQPDGNAKTREGQIITQSEFEQIQVTENGIDK